MSLMSSIEDEEGAVLQIMKIPALKPDGRCPSFEVVLWDSGSTNHYVQITHTERMKFPSKREIMRVSTIGGDVKTIKGVLY